MKNIGLLGLGFLAVASVQRNPHDLDRLPAQEDEIAVQDNTIQFPNQTIQLEGVCKLTEDNAVCWKPNGDDLSSLSDELTEAIQRRSGERFNVSFGKKRRVILFRDTLFPSQQTDYRYGAPYLHPDLTGKFSEGWTNSGSSFGSADSTGFNGARTSRHLVEGVFEKSTTNYPFRLSTQTTVREPRMAPFGLGQIEIDGNVLEVVSIKDHVKAKKNEPKIIYPRLPNMRPSQPDILTDVEFRVIKIRNRFTTVGISVADENGKGIMFVDQKGKPISISEQRKWFEAHSTPRQGQVFPWADAGSAYFDPEYQGVGSTFLMQLYLAKDKIKQLQMNITKRDVYVFEKVALDPVKRR